MKYNLLQTTIRFFLIICEKKKWVKNLCDKKCIATKKYFVTKICRWQKKLVKKSIKLMPKNCANKNYKYFMTSWDRTNLWHNFNLKLDTNMSVLHFSVCLLFRLRPPPMDSEMAWTRVPWLYTNLIWRLKKLQMTHKQGKFCQWSSNQFWNSKYEEIS